MERLTMKSRFALAILAVPAIALLAASGAVAEPILRWSPSDATLEVGDQQTFAVILDDALDVRTMELYVQFDPAVVATVDGGPGALFDGFNLFDGFEEETADTWHGYVVILGAGDWTVGPGELFTWTVDAVAEGISPVVTVEITLLPPGDGDYVDVELTADQITVVDLTASGDVLPDAPRLGLFPNPFNPRTRVEMMLPGGGSGQLQVLDVRGRLVASPWSGSLGSAPLGVDWDGRDRHGEPLPSGVYTFRLLGDGGRVASARGVLVR
jgi:hypothetical protein